MGLTRLQSFVCRAGPRAIGLLAALCVSACFHAPQGLTDPTVLRPFRAGFILSCLVSSSELLRRSSFLPLSEQSVLPGFLPSSRHRRRRPLARKHSRSRFVPPSGFLGLPTVSSASGFAGLSHPAATSRVLRPGVSLGPQPHRLVAGRFPLAVAVRSLTGKPVAMVGRLGFEALFRGPQRSPRSVVGLPWNRSPLRFPASFRLRLTLVAPVPRDLRS